MNISQRALLRVARTCTKEARRAELLGQRRYAREIRGGARRALAEAAAEGSDPLVKAIGCVKNACALAEDLPGRDTDADSHDECVKTMHGHVQSGRSYLEQHLNPNGLPAKSRRLRGSGSGPPPAGPMTTNPMTRSVATVICCALSTRSRKPRPSPITSLMSWTTRPKETAAPAICTFTRNQPTTACRLIATLS
jgi:hypothetical protein